MPTLQILPSLLAADFGRLEAECVRAEQAGADGLHLDIMDGHFVPNLSFGPEVVKLARRVTKLPLSVHLMVSHPHELADAFLDAGSDLLQIQVESQTDVAALLRHIRARGRRPAVVLNPETPLAHATPFLDLVDEVLFMTVHPGFGGQAFIGNVLPKMRALREQRPNLDISVDGGITQQTAPLAAAAGANALIAGTALYRAADMRREVEQMRQACWAAQEKG